jgi:hypothetical protein
MREHARTVIPLAELASREMEESSNMAAEALWRAVIEMIRHVRDGEARVFEQASRSNEPCHGEVALGSWDAGPEKSAHQRAWRDIKVPGEQSDVADTW